MIRSAVLLNHGSMPLISLLHCHSCCSKAANLDLTPDLILVRCWEEQPLSASLARKMLWRQRASNQWSFHLRVDFMFRLRGCALFVCGGGSTGAGVLVVGMGLLTTGWTGAGVTTQSVLERTGLGIAYDSPLTTHGTFDIGIDLTNFFPLRNSLISPFFPTIEFCFSDDILRLRTQPFLVFPFTSRSSLDFHLLRMPSNEVHHATWDYSLIFVKRF